MKSNLKKEDKLNLNVFNEFWELLRAIGNYLLREFYCLLAPNYRLMSANSNLAPANDSLVPANN
ncbi:hypothetical protein, partial [Alloprevotella tannerae]|uniref:hypothetical protein n=1 Tax=Alloprevotella tannerae TaxID=76122 RepID=UPI003C701FA1